MKNLHRYIILSMFVLTFQLSASLHGKGDVLEEQSVLIKISKSLLAESRERGFEFEPSRMEHPKYAVGYMQREIFSSLKKRNPSSIEAMDSLAWSLGAYDEKTFRLKPGFNLEKTIKSRMEGYHDYEALTEELKRLRDAYPDFIRLETAGQSVQGREIWYVVVSDNANTDEPEPKFIYHANMHGNETVGRELMIYFIRHLMEEYNKEPRITQLVNHSQIFIMPSMNPDGFELKRRSNSKGYDLNRNFPDRFKSPDDTPDGRQIEVQHMMKLAKDNHFIFGANFHGGAICFNLPWGNIKNNPGNMYGDDKLFYPIGREYTELNRPMYNYHTGNFDHGLTYGYEWYPINGGINDWFNYYRRSIHSVIELSRSGWPSASSLAGFWDDNREAFITYLWRGLRGIHLEIRDNQGNLVSNPTIEVHTAPERPLVYDNGYVNRMTEDGWQNVTISAEGFLTTRRFIEASYFNGDYTEVIMMAKPQ